MAGATTVVIVVSSRFIASAISKPARANGEADAIRREGRANVSSVMDPIVD
jgi:hypothetical protein